MHGVNDTSKPLHTKVTKGVLLCVLLPTPLAVPQQGLSVCS